MGTYIIPVTAEHSPEREVSPSTESARWRTKQHILVSALLRGDGGQKDGGRSEFVVSCQQCVGDPL